MRVEIYVADLESLSSALKQVQLTYIKTVMPVCIDNKYAAETNVNDLSSHLVYWKII